MKFKKFASFLKLSFGNIMEWYDFSLYIYFANYISVTFFPSKSHYISMLLTMTTFFLGFVARPFGGLLMGWLADRYGRKWAVNLCVLFMGVTTFLIAFIPGYAQIGFLSPLILVFFRIIQGISVGGQFPGLLSLSVDDYKKDKGFAIGMVYSISSLGFLSASLISLLTSFIFSEHNPLAWRLPFALSGVLFLIYLYLNQNRLNLTNTNETTKKQSVISALIYQWRAIFAVVSLTTMAASLYFLVFTYLVTYQIDVLSVSAKNAYFLNTVVLIFACFLYPIFGFVADRVGYLRLFSISMVLLLVLVIPLMWLIQSGDFISIFIALSIFTLLMTSMQGAISPLFAASFDKEWRTTGCAFSYSIGNGISGAAPLIAEIITHYDQAYGMSIFMLLLLLIGSLGMVLIYYHNPSVLLGTRLKESALST